MGMAMAQGYQALTEKEKQTLRLMLRGHDAKSLARHLDLSVHTVNERLRDARRKLEVSSSREAARLLLAQEGRTPDLLGDRDLGEADPGGSMAKPAAFDAPAKAKIRFAWGIAGVTAMSLVFTALALGTLVSGPAPLPAPASPNTIMPEALIALVKTVAPVRCQVLEDGKRTSEAQRRSGEAPADAASWLSQQKTPLRLRCDGLGR